MCVLKKIQQQFSIKLYFIDQQKMERQLSSQSHSQCSSRDEGKTNLPYTRKEVNAEFKISPAIGERTYSAKECLQVIKESLADLDQYQYDFLYSSDLYEEDYKRNEYRKKLKLENQYKIKEKLRLKKQKQTEEKQKIERRQEDGEKQKVNHSQKAEEKQLTQDKLKVKVKVEEKQSIKHEEKAEENQIAEGKYIVARKQKIEEKLQNQDKQKVEKGQKAAERQKIKAQQTIQQKLKSEEKLKRENKQKMQRKQKDEGKLKIEANQKGESKLKIEENQNDEEEYLLIEGPSKRKRKYQCEEKLKRRSITRKVKLHLHCQNCEHKKWTSIVGTIEMNIQFKKHQELKTRKYPYLLIFGITIYRMQCASCGQYGVPRIYQSQLKTFARCANIVLASILDQVPKPKHKDDRHKMNQEIHGHVAELCEACKLGKCFARPKK